MKILFADWPAPDNIGAAVTTRIGGVSQSPYESNNLALHVGDDPTSVAANRDALVKALKLPGEPAWLEQYHSNHCIVVEKTTLRRADAAVTRETTKPLVVMTADCLPILVCDKAGTEIAVIHAGWRGLASGVIENTLKNMQKPISSLMAWVGPAICGACYEVGDEVHQAFAKAYPKIKGNFTKTGKTWYADLPELAQSVFAECGLDAVYSSKLCTKEDEKNFYSYRRDGETGRMATLIWFKQE